jgi:chain length determinant protein EpsF
MENSSVTFDQLIRILLARRRFIVLTFLGTVGIAVLASLLLPKQYTASVDVLIDVKSPEPTTGTLGPLGTAPTYLSTQMAIIASRRVAMEASKRLRLDQDPTMQQLWKQSQWFGEAGDFREWLIQRLTKRITIKPYKQSDVLTVSYKEGDPDTAAKITNALAQAYIDTNTELAAQPALQNSKWFKEHAQALKEELEQAQAHLSAFRQSTGIVSVDRTRLDYETAKLNDISAQLTQNQSENAQAQSRSSPGAGADVLPEVMQNSLAQTLRAGVAEREAKLEQLGRRLGRNHPEYQQLQTELDALKEQLDAQDARVAASISMANRVGETKGGYLGQALAAQKRRVLELNGLQDRAELLERDVDVARKAYDAVAQRFVQASLASQSSLTNVAILTPAWSPPAPSFPKLKINLAIALFLGALFGVGGALAREALDHKVRASPDITAHVGIALLGEFPKIRTMRPDAGGKHLAIKQGSMSL